MRERHMRDHINVEKGLFIANECDLQTSLLEVKKYLLFLRVVFTFFTSNSNLLMSYISDKILF